MNNHRLPELRICPESIEEVTDPRTGVTMTRMIGLETKPSAQDSTILIVSKSTYDEIRRMLMTQGTAGHFDERGASKRIDLTGVTIQRESDDHERRRDPHAPSAHQGYDRARG